MGSKGSEETTILLIKPDGVERDLAAIIIGMLPSRNLRIIGVKLITNVSREIAEEHYSEHIGRDFFPWLIEQITSGPIIALAICGPNAIKSTRKLAGDTDPAKADSESIRGMFGKDSLERSREELRAVWNVVHTPDPDDPLSAERELALWFSPNELLPR